MTDGVSTGYFSGGSIQMYPVAGTNPTPLAPLEPLPSINSSVAANSPASTDQSLISGGALSDSFNTPGATMPTTGLLTSGIQNFLNSATGNGATGTATNFFQRAVAIVLGLILIAVGAMMFRPVQDAASSAVRIAA